MNENGKKAVKQFSSAVKPRSFQRRLEKYLSFNRMELRKNFKKFMAHAMELSAAFQKLGCGPENQKAPSKNVLKRTDGSGKSGN